MLESGSVMLEQARRRGAAVASFNVYTLESLRAVCDGAAEVGEPVIIAAGSSAFTGVGRALLAGAAVVAARSSEARVGVHLDHCRDPEEIKACIEMGYTSVMIDGSHLPFAENVALTREVADFAHERGVWVEGEIGGIAGREDASSGARAVQLTDPEQAEQFVELTGIDVLAPAVGTVHGFTPDPVEVDIRRLTDIAGRTGVPLALHGGSGLTDDQLHQAVQAGIAKVNINAELRRAYLGGVDAARPTIGDDVAALQTQVVAAMTAVVVERMRILT